MRTQIFDYVVVGSGSAGSVVAARLAEDPQVSVALLEAGRPDSHPWLAMPLAFMSMSWHPRYIWPLETDPEPALEGRRLEFRRGKTLGGTSSINGMIFARGHPKDYDGWRDLGLRGWSYADVLPYFRKLENSWRGASEYHGDNGPVGVTQVRDPRMLYEPLEAAAKRFGLPAADDYLGRDTEGVSRIELAVHGGERQSTSHRYLRRLGPKQNLEVVTSARVTRIILEGRRAVGVELVRDGETMTLRARHEVVLSAGPYGSPHLLMLSGIGPADHLKAHGIAPHVDLRGVGQNLSEHPNMVVNFLARRKHTFVSQLRLDRAAVSVSRWHLTRSGAFTNNGATAVIFAKTRPDLDRPDVQLICMPIANYAKLWFPMLTKPPLHCFAVRVGTLYPKSRGNVRLRSANPEAPPRIQFNLMSEPSDVQDMIAALRITRGIYGEEPMRSLIDRELVPGPDAATDEQLEAAIRTQVHVRQHALGTCAMGTGQASVVDAELRVHGVEHLRVVDASVIPDQIGGNTNIPTIMIAEKAADLILGRSLPPALLPPPAI